MSPKVDQISGGAFSVNNTQASSSHSLSTQCICSTSVMSMRDNRVLLHWLPVIREKDIMFPYMFHFRGLTLIIGAF